MKFVKWEGNISLSSKRPCPHLKRDLKSSLVGLHNTIRYRLYLVLSSDV